MTTREKRKEFLEYIREALKPFLVYYPASGWDTLPKEVFGANNVIHLSLRKDEKETGYFEKLGDGIKIFGNMKNSPLADKSVDAIYLNLHGLDSVASESIKDFKRVLKDNGAVFVEGRNYYGQEKWGDFSKILGDNFLKENLPENFQGQQTYYGVKKDNNENEEKILESQEKMMDFVSENKEWSGFEAVFNYAVFRKK